MVTRPEQAITVTVDVILVHRDCTGTYAAGVLASI